MLEDGKFLKVREGFDIPFTGLRKVEFCIPAFPVRME
jgi:hypothetical protein